MDEEKRRFIEFLFAKGLNVFEDPSNDRSLKSKRLSPWFLNLGDFNDGQTLGPLSDAYAELIINSGVPVDSLYGIPEKGVGFVGPVAVAMAGKGQNVSWFFTRKMPKEHGEGTATASPIVGRTPQTGQRICQLDDVFTTGDTKYEARETLRGLGNFELPLLAIALDRQEVGIDGNSAIKEYEAKTGTRVISAVSATDVLDYLKEQANVEGTDSSLIGRRIERLSNYLRVYGTDEARSYVGRLEQRIVERERAVVPACDVPFEQFEEIVKQTAGVDGIGAYKIPAISGRRGWERWVETARRHTDKPLIYDHQKAGTDIPDTGREFMQELKAAGFDAVILFPQSGPETERAWIYRAFENGLKVIVGGWMTHPAYTVSEGGFIADEGARQIYRIAARAGVSNFVVPGTKPEVIAEIGRIIEAEGVEPDLYSPGLIAQGGKIADAAQAAGKRFKGIIGTGIYRAKDMNAAAREYCSQL